MTNSETTFKLDGILEDQLLGWALEDRKSLIDSRFSTPISISISTQLVSRSQLAIFGIGVFASRKLMAGCGKICESLGCFECRPS